MPSLTILIATSNPGKLRDFAGAATHYGVTVGALPGFSDLPSVVEGGATFAANAIKKAAFYSQYAVGQLVLSDDSGLEVAALNGAPGVHSARYAAAENPANSSSNSEDDANNQRLLRELAGVTSAERHARFVCVLAAARDGRLLSTFEGEVCGEILSTPRGKQGFGYDPLFFLPELGKTMAELSSEEKAAVSHRGRAFEKFLDWMKDQQPSSTT